MMNLLCWLWVSLAWLWLLPRSLPAPRPLRMRRSWGLAVQLGRVVFGVRVQVMLMPL